MENEKTEIQLEGILSIKKGGELIAVVYNNINKKAQIFYGCKDMGAEDIKQLLENITQK